MKKFKTHFLCFQLFLTLFYNKSLKIPLIALKNYSIFKF